MLDFKQILSVSLILFSVIDILGSIPIVINLRKKVGHIKSERATLAAGLLMLAFLLVGESILRLFGIGVSDFAIAGALIIFALGAEMILGIELFYAAQAMDYHAPLKSGKIMTAIYERVRKDINPVVSDRILYEDMETAIELVKSGELIELAKMVAKSEGLAFETNWSELFNF